jgi:membrane fusion protein (multidrug efflux system)
MKTKKTNKKFIIIFSVLFILGGGYGTYKYVYSLYHETTDDAQIEKNMSPIIPKVSGYITKVYVDDNAYVKKGDTLFTIEQRDYVLKVQDAAAALVAAEGSLAASFADVSGMKASISASDANHNSAANSIESAQIKLRRAKADFELFAYLYKNRSITKQQFEQAEATLQEAENQLKIVKEQERASNYQKAAMESKTTVTQKQSEIAAANTKRAQAMLDVAKMNLEYTVVTAAKDGQVSNIAIQPGQLVQAGQSLFYIINNDEVWVTANFKETQLSHMIVGQKVTVHIDAFPNDDFEGSITSFSPATGARFSLLPPDNATGNFVKTIQRLPVKISLSNKMNGDKLKLIRPGMNVTVDVHLQ